LAALIERIAAVSSSVRYVAIYRDGELSSWQREGLSGASESESDKYEELIVNPTLLKLVTQRGNIDCGGAAYVVIRYGNFFEIVMPAAWGHVSVGVEPTGDPIALQAAIAAVI
jgi:hypothetical protein